MTLGMAGLFAVTHDIVPRSIFFWGGGSDQANEFALYRAVALYVSLCGTQRAVASQLLHVTQRSIYFGK